MIRILSRPGTHGSQDHYPALDLTALVDVIFILMVFFLLTANSVDRALLVDLPEDGADQATPVTASDPITLTLFAGAPRWQVNQQPFQDWAAVEQAILRLRVERPAAEILIAGDRQVPLERLLQALAFLGREGLRAAEILMENHLSDPTVIPTPDGAKR